LLGMGDSNCAEEQECRKERAILFTHGPKPPYSKMIRIVSFKVEE
jgi:hypothetical protein